MKAGRWARSFLTELRNDPFAARGRIGLAVGMLRALVVFRGCECGWRVSASGTILVRADGHIRLGDRVVFVEGLSSSELVCHEGALLEIGEDTGFNGGISIEAARKVTIGRRCSFGSMIRVSDRGPAG